MLAAPVLMLAAALLLAGAVLAHVIGASAVLGFWAAGREQFLAALPQRIIAQIDLFSLMSMPLFMLTGEIMNRAGVTRALLNLAVALVGRLRGGLGHVNILTSLFFAGISGSAMADAASISNTLVPAMRKAGYSAHYAGAITAASSVIGPIIPPSIVMIFYGALTQTSVAALFIGGIIPGLMLAGALFIANAVLAKRHDHPRGEWNGWSDLGRTLAKAFPALFIPAIILGGIVFGVTTPTEAAAVAVLCSILVGVLYGEMTVRVLWESAQRTAILTGSIFLLLSAVACLGYLAGLEQIPARLAGWLINLGFEGNSYLLLITVIFLVAGMFLEVPVALALLVPLLVPPAVAMGIDPIHLGISIVVNLTIGICTPPFGAAILVVSTVTATSYWAICRAIMPFLVAEIAVLLVITFTPQTVLFLPRLFGFAGGQP